MYKKKSLLGNYWKLEEPEERLILSTSQKNQITPLLSKLLLNRNIDIVRINDFLKPDLKNNIPNPFLLKDMKKTVDRVIISIFKKEKIGIISDYDVDGSTSASILYKFLSNFSKNIFISTPNRLLEGYGPNLRIMNEMLDNEVSLIFTLDCGTTSFDIIDNKKYSKIDVIVIDHHLSETIFPNVYSIINPNRYDENSEFNQMAAVGITFLFIMALRKTLREKNFFKSKIHEPNLLNYLDLVALGTVCDVVKLIDYNRIFVKKGLELIKERSHRGITQIIDNSNLNSTPDSTDLGFIIGPQLNAASRLDDSSLPTKLLISNNKDEIESISRKLVLLNEKRKLIEKNIFEEALNQVKHNNHDNFILVYGKNWHNGVLGIVASRLLNRYHKPTFVISFNHSLGLGSARSINSIDLGNIILSAKNKKLLIEGGGHKMAAGLKIDFKYLNQFLSFLRETLNQYPKITFQKTEIFDSILSVNEINNDLLEDLKQIEPFGAGNPEPKFIINDIKIENIKILKAKHILVFFKNDFSINLKGICFNCIETILGDYLINFKKHNLAIGCIIKSDNYNQSSIPQIIIKDAMIIN